jgi:hypothetical protein
VHFYDVTDDFLAFFNIIGRFVVMVLDEFVDDVSTVSFLNEITGLEVVQRISLHEEDLISDHRYELRTDYVETALEDLEEMTVIAFIAFPRTKWEAKDKKKRIFTFDL